MNQPSLSQIYQARLNEGLSYDPAQFELVKLLDRLGRQVVSQDHRRSWTNQFWRRWFKQDSQTAKGLYIFGGVGRGKTLLMDLFFDWLPITAKRRVHFHRFMSSVHSQLQDLEGTTNPLEIVAKRISSTSRVLCFDEFFVSDIGDAMILANVLRGIFEQGVVLVATSNIKPNKLYENGLQRSQFLPAIELLETHTQVIEFPAGKDYRLELLRNRELYRIVEGGTAKFVDADIAQLVKGDVKRETSLDVLGRFLSCVFDSDGVAGFTFANLCETARSTEDYIELSRVFHTVVLYEIPPLVDTNASAIRRFINLIDEFYDRNVNMLFYAAKPITELYLGSLFEHDFERTRSRILEMQSDTYLSKAHKT